MQDIADGYRTEYAPQGKSPYAHMPGDDLEAADEFEMDGPVSAATQRRVLGPAVAAPKPTNPAEDLGGPLELSRQLREGKIPHDREREVRAYLQQYERFAGETLYDPRNHVLSVPEDEIPGDGGLHRADRWPR